MRPDKEKIIKALRHCTGHGEKACRGCPYNNNNASCLGNLLGETLALIEALTGEEDAHEDT